MPPGQRTKQNVQGFLGVNLRRDRVSLADAELARAINADMHSQPGAIVLRRGRRQQFANALDDLVIRRSALVNGVRYVIAGQSVYRDGSKIFDGVLSPTLFSTMVPFRPLADTATWVFIADESGMRKDDGTRPVEWGIDTPDVPIVKQGGVGTALAGDYIGGYTHLRYDEDAIAHESNAAQGEDTITLISTGNSAGGKLAIGDMQDAPNEQVTGIGVYRSVAGGALLLRDTRAKFPKTSTFSVTHGWEVTAAPGGTVADGLIHHWTLDKNTKRGTQDWEPVAAPGLHLVSQTAITGAASFIMPEHKAGDLIVVFACRTDSTSPPAVPSGWTTWGTGSGANVTSSIGGYKVATSSAETSGTWSGATGLVCHVYRGQRVAGAIGGTADTGDYGTTISYPTVTMTDTASTSIVVGFAGIRAPSSRLESAPSGMVNRSGAVSVAASPAIEVAGHDTDSTVTAWTTTTVAVGGGAAGWRARTLEIRGEPTTSDTTGTSEDVNGRRATHLWEINAVLSIANPNLITNPDFGTSISGWTDQSVVFGAFSWSPTAGGRARLDYTGPSGSAWAQQAITTVAGQGYRITTDLRAVSGTSAIDEIRIGTTSGGAEISNESSGTLTTALTAYSKDFTATTTTTYIQFRKTSVSNPATFDNVDVSATTDGTLITLVTTQTKRWAYASIKADSDLGDEAPGDNDTPPSGTYVTEHLSHLFLCRFADNPHHLRWSERFEPERWPADNLLEIGNPDDPLQCVVPIAGILGVFSKATKYRLVGNSTSSFVAQEAISKRGTPAPLAVVPTEYGIIFPHHDGIFRTDLLSRDEELSSEIAPIFYGETMNDYPPINWAAAQTFSAAYRKGRYYFAYASGDSSTPNTMAVYSRTTGKWYFYDHPARSLLVESGDDETLTAGFTDGLVYVLEEGESDAGDDIALDCETKDYFGGDPDVRKLAQWARVDADCDDDAVSVDMYVDGVLKRTATLTGSRTRRLLSFPEGSMGFTARLGFRYEGTARPRIYGATIIWLPLEFS